MFNIKNSLTIEQNYTSGLLPQRNIKGAFYQDTSCRSNLATFSLSSENRRILRKTAGFKFSLIPLNQFKFNLNLQKTIFQWVKDLGWDFPTSSVKLVFTHHIFNYLYVWKKDEAVVGYSICYFDSNISHIAYVFYNPQFAHQELPIRMVLQVTIDSHAKNLKYCYLGRDHSRTVGFYKRNMPGYEFFNNHQWQKL